MGCAPSFEQWEKAEDEEEMKEPRGRVQGGEGQKIKVKTGGGQERA